MEEEKKVFVVDNQTGLGELPGCLKASVAGKATVQLTLNGRQQSAESAISLKLFSDPQCTQPLATQIEWGVGKSLDEKSIRTPLEAAQSFQTSPIGRREMIRIR